MFKRFRLTWLYFACLRALRTFAQVALAIGFVSLLSESISLTYLLLISGLSGLFSVITSMILGLVENGSDGVVQVTVTPDKETYLLSLNDELETMKEKQVIKLEVKLLDDSHE